MSECKLCDGSGRIPFKNEEGKTIPNVWIYCSCHPEQEHHSPLKPKDFDFPCSDSFRGYYHQEYGRQDPGYIPPQQDTVELEDRIADLEALIASPSQIPRRFNDELKQLKSQMLYLQSKVIQYQAHKKEEAKSVTLGRRDVTDEVWK